MNHILLVIIGCILISVATIGLKRDYDRVMARIEDLKMEQTRIIQERDELIQQYVEHIASLEDQVDISVSEMSKIRAEYEFRTRQSIKR